MSETVCQRMRRLRQQKRLTLSQVASEVGVTKSLVCYWESGKRLPRAAHAVKMAQLFGVEIGYLLAEPSTTAAATFDPLPRELSWPGGSVRFTPQIARIFEAVARSNSVATWEHIEGFVWPDGDVPDSKTLKVQVHRLRRSLREAGSPVQVLTAWGRGLYCSPRVEIASAQTVALSRGNVAILRELLETHPNGALVDRAYAALGAF